MCFSCYSTSMPIFPLLPLFCIILLSLNSNCAKVLYSVNRNPTYDPTCMTSWVVNVSFRSIVWALYAALLYCLLLSAIVYNNSEKNKWLMVEWAFTSKLVIWYRTAISFAIFRLLSCSIIYSMATKLKECLMPMHSFWLIHKRQQN